MAYRLASYGILLPGQAGAYQQAPLAWPVAADPAQGAPAVAGGGPPTRLTLVARDDRGHRLPLFA